MQAGLIFFFFLFVFSTMSQSAGARDSSGRKGALRGARALLPLWSDVHLAGWPTQAAVSALLKSNIFLEYEVETDGAGQGQAVAVFSKKLRLPTKAGVYFTGVHVAASDRRVHRFMQRGKKDMGEVHYFHIVRDSEDADRAQSESEANARSGKAGSCVHITRFRVLTRHQVLEIPYARECAEQYLDALDEVTGGLDSDTGGGSEPPEKRTRVSFKSPATDAPEDPAWDAALGPRFTPGSGSTPSGDLDEDLAKRLAEADANARKAAKQHGINPGTKSKPVAQPPRVPRTSAPVLDPEADDAHGEPADDAEDIAESSASASSRRSPGVAMQAELLRAAQRRAKASSAKKSEVQSKHSRLVDTLRDLGKLLGGGGAVEADSVEEAADAPHVDSEPESAVSLFRGAPSSLSGPETTSSFAARRPGELLAGGVKRVRGILSAIHGEEATKSEGQRLFSFYFRVYLRPRLGDVGPHSDREMTTLVEALDSLLEGNTARTGDILVTRLKALEEAARSGNWSMAQQFEAVAQDDFGLITDGERQHAATLQLRAARLRETTSQAAEGRRGR